MRSTENIRPFLKWAGGKYRLVDRISAYMSPGKRLIEPFMGSGAVFLNTEFDHYLLGDVNPDLINIYQLLKSDSSNFIDYCQDFFQPHYNSSHSYYNLREEFNSLEAGIRKSALFLYLNRHGFNGLCRYNQKGEFNVPFGKYLKPYFPKKELIQFADKARRATFVCADFESLMKRARRGNVVYCDPPYVPISPTAYFTNYAQSGFSLHDQERLAMQSKKLAQRGVSVIISNHENELTRTLYTGAKIVSFEVQRNISCQGDLRGKADELLAIFEARL